LKNVLAGLLVVTVVTGGALSWFASANPDGLEWSMFHTSGKEALEVADQGPYALAARLQEKTAFLPDYGFRKGEEQGSARYLRARETRRPKQARARRRNGLTSAPGNPFRVCLAQR
jgi:hypothetical protein